MGDKKQRAPIEQALQTIYNTKVGKDLLDRVPLKGLTIEFANLPQHKHGEFFPSQKTIRLSNRLSLSNSGSEVLFHELRHYAQLCEGRNNLHNRGDGIEGYVDFATAKLCEVEANLFDSIYLAEISPYKSDRISQRQRSQYYQELEKKYRGQTQNEDEAARLARTEYVQTLWETSKCKTGGPESFSHWINNYNQNFINWSLQAPVGKRDIQK